MENCPLDDTRNCPQLDELRRAEVNKERITENLAWDDPRGQEMKTPDDAAPIASPY
jgi:hypothetical protein